MRIVALLLGLILLAPASADVVPSMAQMNIALHPEQSLPLKSKITFELELTNVKGAAQALKAWPGIDVKVLDEETLRVTMMPKPKFSGEVIERYTQSSFVVDFNEQSTQEFVSGFELDSFNRLQQLTEYVDNFIDKPSYIHGFNIASVIASQRSGDCTEYAVLAAALARAIALPARVIIGSIIVESETDVQAFGHAWTEVWHKGQWHILDAAMNQSDAKQVFYLPTTELEKEGPGFALSLMKAGSLMPAKIKGLRDA